MRFYNFEENFYREAKLAELSAAKVSIKIKRLKAAFIGGALPIARLAVMLLPLLSVLIPLMKASFVLPFIKSEFPVSGLGLYNMYSNGTLMFILDMAGDKFNGADFALFRNVIFAEAAVAVLGLLVFLLTILCFISIKKMSVILCTVSGLGVVGSLASFIMAIRFCSVTGNAADSVINGTMSFGWIISLLMFAAVFVINLMILIKGIEIEYGEGDLERAEIAKKVKSGELKIEDLPQPIVETAETRAIEEEIRKQHEKIFNKSDESESESESENESDTDAEAKEGDAE
ncbi:MAG: hypothetical protein K6F09_01640 [Clostridiales bacterium]|nr:hypothetical protein [Clostridiales bacterium]